MMGLTWIAADEPTQKSEPAVTVYWLDDSGAIPAGMSEDLSGWWWGIGMDGLNSYCDGPFATKQDAIAASQMRDDTSANDYEGDETPLAMAMEDAMED